MHSVLILAPLVLAPPIEENAEGIFVIVLVLARSFFVIVIVLVRSSRYSIVTTLLFTHYSLLSNLLSTLYSHSAIGVRLECDWRAIGHPVESHTDPDAIACRRGADRTYIVTRRYPSSWHIPWGACRIPCGNS